MTILKKPSRKRDDFGWLWEKAQKQEWWDEFIYDNCFPVFARCYAQRRRYHLPLAIVDHARFPKLIVDFLKECKP